MAIIIALILSGLALLAAVVCLVLVVQNKKRSQKQNAAALQLFGSLEKDFKAYRDNYKKLQQEQEALRGKFAVYDKKLPKLFNNVNDLMQGIVPDYEDAVRARKEVDQLSRDIAEIIGFDPLRAAKEARTQRRNGYKEDD